MKTSVVLLVLVAAVAAASEQEEQYRTVPSPRIVGGDEAIPNSIPYQAFLTSRAIISSVDTTWTCSGSIITKNYILSAADCVYKHYSSSQTTSIVLGAHNVSSLESTQVYRGVAAIIVYPTYPNRPSIQNNVALVKMDREIEYNFAVQPIGLPSRAEVLDQESFIGHTARVSGWGLRNGAISSSSSNVLYYIYAPVMKSSECKKSYLHDGIDITTLCTFGRVQDTICEGDVGAPLVADFKQIGISSLWYTKCATGYPSVYTRVTSFMDWIVDNSDYVWPF